MYVEIRSIIDDLIHKNEIITWTSIGKMVGKNPLYLRRFQSVKEMIGYSIDIDRNNRIRKQRNEILIVDRVQHAIQTLRLEGMPVTWLGVGKIVNMTPQALRHYNAVKEIMIGEVDNVRKYSPEYKQQQEHKLLEDVKILLLQLRLSGNVNWEAFCGALGKSRSCIKSYSQVYTLISSEINMYRCKRRIDVESELLAKVRYAIFMLNMEGRDVNFSAVGQIIDVGEIVLKRYSRILELFAR